MISDIKKEARMALQGKWGMAIVVTLLAELIMGAFASTGIGVIFSVILSVGVYHAFTVGMMEGDNFRIEDLFHGFKDGIGNRIVLALLKTIFIWLWSLLLIIPGIIKTFSWAMSGYVSYKHPEYDYKKCLDESKRMMNGHKWDLFVLYLSFIGWLILSALTFGILYIVYVGPYIQASEVKFFEKVYSENN